jgi:hypothetical protein
MQHTPGPWKHVGLPGGWDGVASEQDGLICKLVYNNPVNASLIAEAPALKARVAELEVELKDSNLSLQSQQVEIGQLKAKVTDLELTIIRALGMCAVEPGFDAWHILDYLEEALAGRKEGA